MFLFPTVLSCCLVRLCCNLSYIIPRQLMRIHMPFTNIDRSLEHAFIQCCLPRKLLLPPNLWQHKIKASYGLTSIIIRIGLVINSVAGGIIAPTTNYIQVLPFQARWAAISLYTEPPSSWNYDRTLAWRVNVIRWLLDEMLTLARCLSKVLQNRGLKLLGHLRPLAVPGILCPPHYIFCTDLQLYHWHDAMVPSSLVLIFYRFNTQYNVM